MTGLRLLFLALLVAGMAAQPPSPPPPPAWNATIEWAEPASDGWFYSYVTALSTTPQKQIGMVAGRLNYLYSIGNNNNYPFLRVNSMYSTATSISASTSAFLVKLGQTAQVTGMAVDPSTISGADIVYVVGYTLDDLDGFHSISTYSDPFIMRFDISSTTVPAPIWITQFGDADTSVEDRALAVTVGANGDVFVTGTINKNLGNQEDTFVIKFAKADITANIAANNNKDTKTLADAYNAALADNDGDGFADGDLDQDGTVDTAAQPVRGTYGSVTVLSAVTSAEADVPKRIAVSSSGEVFVVGTREIAPSLHEDLFVAALNANLSPKWFWSDSSSSLLTTNNERPAGLIIQGTDVLVTGTRNGTYDSTGAITSGSTFVAKFSSSAGSLTWSFVDAPTSVAGDVADAVTAMSGPMPTTSGQFFIAGYALRAGGSYDRVFVQSFGSDLTAAITGLSPSYTRLTKSVGTDDALPYSSSTYATSTTTPYRTTIESIVTVPNRRLPLGSDAIYLAGTAEFLKVASGGTTYYYLPFILKIVTPPRE